MIRDRAILELLYATGIRNEELRTATLYNLDLEEKTLFVTGKGSKDRVVPIGSWGYSVASRIHGNQPSSFL